MSRINNVYNMPYPTLKLNDMKIVSITIIAYSPETILIFSSGHFMKLSINVTNVINNTTNIITLSKSTSSVLVPIIKLSS